MATAVKSYGIGVFGIADPETVLITHSISHSFSTEKKSIKDELGNDVGVTYFNPKCEISIEGGLLAAGYTEKVGEEIVLAMAITDNMYAAVGGTYVLDTLDIKYINEDYATISVKATCYPYVTA